MLVFNAGFQVFTPEDISDSMIISTDRPYASYTYVSGGWQSYDDHFQRQLRVQLYLGVLGSDFPGKFQTKVHEIVPSPRPNGWDHQIGDGIQFAPNIHFNFQRNHLTLGKSKKRKDFSWVQIGNMYEVNAGLYMTNLAYGLKFSFINFRSKLGLIIDPDIPTLALSKQEYEDFRMEKYRQKIEDEKDAASRDKLKNKLNKKEKVYDRKGVSFNIFFLPQVKYVVHNSTLQGSLIGTNVYKLSGRDIKRYVWNLEGGLNFSAGALNVSYIVQARTQEFKFYAKNWHTFAGIALGFTF